MEFIDWWNSLIGGESCDEGISFDLSLNLLLPELNSFVGLELKLNRTGEFLGYDARGVNGLVLANGRCLEIALAL